MRFLRQSITGVFLAAITLGLMVFAVQTVRDAMSERMAADRQPPSGRERVFTVAVMRAELGTVTPVLDAYGEIRAVRSVALRAAVPGTVIDIAPGFVEGGTVRAGDVLVRIDPFEAQAARDRVAADLADAQAEMRDAAAALTLARDELAAARVQADLQARALSRQQDLAARGVGTGTAVEAAELAEAAARQSVLARRQALAQAEARGPQAATRLQRAEIALAEAERRLADTVVRAPFDGALSAVALTQGGRVAGNEQIAQLVDPSALEVAFRLSTAQYTRLLDAAGQLTAQPVEVRLDAGGVDLRARGRIARDSAAVGEAQSGRLVFATLERALGFKPGDFVTVSVEEPALDAVVRLPAAALGSGGDVLALGPEDRLEALPVTLVRRQGNDVLVRGAGSDTGSDTGSNTGLPGREIVTARTPLLGPGISVRPLRLPGADEEAAAPRMLELSADRRARLIAFVEGNARMPEGIKAQVLAQLAETRVPAQVVERLESRMGG